VYNFLITGNYINVTRASTDQGWTFETSVFSRISIDQGGYNAPFVTTDSGGLFVGVDQYHPKAAQPEDQEVTEWVDTRYPFEDPKARSSYGFSCSLMVDVTRENDVTADEWFVSVPIMMAGPSAPYPEFTGFIALTVTMAALGSTKDPDIIRALKFVPKTSRTEGLVRGERMSDYRIKRDDLGRLAGSERRATPAIGKRLLGEGF